MTTDERPEGTDMGDPLFKVHEVKSWPEEYQALIDGRKTAEWRRNDRDYRAGDLIVFREWEPVTVPTGAILGNPSFEADTGVGAYTGRGLVATISDVLSGSTPRGRSFGVPESFAMVSVALAIHFDVDDPTDEWQWKLSL